MSKRKILVIDDDPSIHDLLKVIFEEEGFQIMGPRRGERAGNAGTGGKPDLIILDILMPEVNGFEVLEGLKADKETRDIPVIILSVQATSEDIDRALAMGADRYVRKPFQRSEMLEAARLALSNSDRGRARNPE